MLNTKKFIETHNGKVSIGENCDISSDFCVEMDEEDTKLIIGKNVSIRRNVTIQVIKGATVYIGNDVAIGENVFMSSMVAIIIGDGCGISNMVDLHDHNHRKRRHSNLNKGSLTPYDSGFAAAPIILDHCAILSNKVTVTAGCWIGQNTIIGANTVVTKSVEANKVLGGVPGIDIDSFIGELTKSVYTPTINIGYFGTSIMEHLKPSFPKMNHPWDFPKVGESVQIDKIVHGGYVQQAHELLTVQFPYFSVHTKNYGKGGATSRDILTIINDEEQQSSYKEIAFYGCGINDVWRTFQKRTDEAVLIDEFKDNYTQSVSILKERYRTVICVLETPFSKIVEDYTQMNNTLLSYNQEAINVARKLDVMFINPWNAFQTFNQLPADEHTVTPWSDGVHLNSYGDAVMSKLVTQHLSSEKILEKMSKFKLIERSLAANYYKSVVSTIINKNTSTLV